MTTIAAVSATVSTIAALPQAPPLQSTIQPIAPSSVDDSPAVIVNLSSSAQATSAKNPLPSLDSDKVDNALAGLGGANGFADLAAHYDKNNAARKFGEAIADRGAATAEGAAVSSRDLAVSYASTNGIPFQTATTSDPKTGSTAAPFSVADFSFTSGGSTYSITNQPNGTLRGTKDGQYWNSWQLTTPTSATDPNKAAETALQTLTASNANKVSSDTSLTGINISA